MSLYTGALTFDGKILGVVYGMVLLGQRLRTNIYNFNTYIDYNNHTLLQQIVFLYFL